MKCDGPLVIGKHRAAHTYLFIITALLLVSPAGSVNVSLALPSRMRINHWMNHSEPIKPFMYKVHNER